MESCPWRVWAVAVSRDGASGDCVVGAYHGLIHVDSLLRKVSGAGRRLRQADAALHRGALADTLKPGAQVAEVVEVEIDNWIKAEANGLSVR